MRASMAQTDQGGKTQGESGSRSPSKTPATPGRLHPRRWFRRFRSLGSEEGASMVEMGFAFLLLLPILFGLLELCLVFYAHQCVADSAHRAGRWASMRGAESCTNTPLMPQCNATANQIQTFVRGIEYRAIDSSKMTVTTTWLAAGSGVPMSWTACATRCNARGNQVRVHVSYAFPIAFTNWSVKTINLNSTGSAAISQ
jgi:Flp pilus assembly protein TadG